MTDFELYRLVTFVIASPLSMIQKKSRVRTSRAHQLY